jgi:hypothetical protein
VNPERQIALDLHAVPNLGIVNLVGHDSERVSIDLDLASAEKPESGMFPAADHDTEPVMGRLYALFSVEHGVIRQIRRMLFLSRHSTTAQALSVTLLMCRALNNGAFARHYKGEGV